MLRPSTFLLCAALCFTYLSGCNTDGMWNVGSDRHVPRMPGTQEGVQDIAVADTQEVDLVEQVLYHRKHYRQALTDLRDFYIDRGSHTKRKWAEYELADLGKVKPFKYILDAEIPASSLRPQHSVADADRLYEKGLNLMERGGHGVPALYRKELMDEAVNTFTELITKYPTSDKIDDAAYCCGEIYKEYYRDQEPLAVKWYERAFTWDPNTPHPVRFQAAVVYDFRLHDRAKALELYHEVLRSEADNKSNAAFASRRIHELTEGIGQIRSPRPPLRRRTTGATPADMFGADASPMPRTAPPRIRPAQPASNERMETVQGPVRQSSPPPAPVQRPQASEPRQVYRQTQPPPRQSTTPPPKQSTKSQPTFDSLNAQRASKEDLVPIVNLGPDD